MSSPASSAPRPSSGIGGPCSTPLVTLRLRAEGATVCKVFEGCFRGRDLICHKDPEAPQRLRPATGLGNGEGCRGSRRQVWGLLEKQRTWTRTEGLSVAFFFFSPSLLLLIFFHQSFCEYAFWRWIWAPFLRGEDATTLVTPDRDAVCAGDLASPGTDSNSLDEPERLLSPLWTRFPHL